MEHQENRLYTFFFFLLGNMISVVTWSCWTLPLSFFFFFKCNMFKSPFCWNHSCFKQNEYKKEHVLLHSMLFFLTHSFFSQYSHIHLFIVLLKPTAFNPLLSLTHFSYFYTKWHVETMLTAFWPEIWNYLCTLAILLQEGLMTTWYYFSVQLEFCFCFVISQNTS